MSVERSVQIPTNAVKTAESLTLAFSRMCRVEWDRFKAFEKIGPSIGFAFLDGAKPTIVTCFNTQQFLVVLEGTFVNGEELSLTYYSAPQLPFPKHTIGAGRGRRNVL